MSDDLLARDRRHLWHPFTQHASPDDPLVVTSASGPWLTLADGRRVLDGISSWWTNLHGHGHPRLAAAIARQAATLDHVHFAGVTHAPAVEAAERLLARAPRGLTRVFFSDDGSTAVEVAVKMALQAQAQRGHPERVGYVAFEHAYHGDTVGALSVGDPGTFASPFGRLTFPVARAPVPADAAGVPTALAALETLLVREGARTAAVILEPMLQAAGGMRVHPPAFLRGVADLARRHGCLLVADEVMTGFHRTGPCFAVEHAGVTPDLLCVAKGLTGGLLPLAATLATDEVFRAFLDPTLQRAFLHGHSYTGSPIACAAAVASLELLDEPATQTAIGALGAVHERRLAALARHPRVATMRHLGTLGAFELRTAAAGYFEAPARALARDLLDRGLLVRPLGAVVYLLPPYATSTAELDAAYDAIESAL
jgi:adenosylmethionine-8-amino-7-oxononanoate aminotransferase